MNCIHATHRTQFLDNETPALLTLNDKRCFSLFIMIRLLTSYTFTSDKPELNALMENENRSSSIQFTSFVQAIIIDAT